jgi:hypothetical protein
MSATVGAHSHPHRSAFTPSDKLEDQGEYVCNMEQSDN